MIKLFPRRLEEEDLLTRVQWFNTPSVYHQMPISVPLSLSETRSWFAGTLLDVSRRDLSFDLLEDERKILVAMSGLTHISYQHKHAELYVLVDPKRTSQGIGQNVLQWLCNFGFIELGLNRIYLFTVENNRNARRLYESLGFSHEGVLKENILHHGKFIDRHVQALLKSEWELQPWKQDIIKLEIVLK